MEPLSSSDSQFDFAALLEESFENPRPVSRGDILKGTVVAIDQYGVIVDVGLKRDGVVPRYDLEAVSDTIDLAIGQTVTVMVANTEDKEGNLVVSLQQAVASKDWTAAQKHMDADRVYSGIISGANRGGLIVPYGELRGFVPASHLISLPRGLSEAEREQALNEQVGQKMDLKIIEVNPERRRLVFSQRLAVRENREKMKDRLLKHLNEGDIVTGRVSSVREFGAFVDLGGADGLIHVSELAWQRVSHPNEVVEVGDCIDVYVLQLEPDRQRIGLSLKRLKPNPWVDAETCCKVGDVVDGIITRVVSFGAFVELRNGIEALLHSSELGSAPDYPLEDLFIPGEPIVAKVISVEPNRQRMGLSIQEFEWNGFVPPQPSDYTESTS